MKAIFESKQSQDQINWGSNDNPNNVLEVGKVYEVLEEEVHSWHTKLILKDFPNKKFNCITFKYITEASHD